VYLNKQYFNQALLAVKTKTHQKLANVSIVDATAVSTSGPDEDNCINYRNVGQVFNVFLCFDESFGAI